MGHEYVEMKNSHAAIEAYRIAVGSCYHIERISSPTLMLCRGEPKRLQSVVRTGPSLRTFEHASVCAALLPTRHITTVRKELFCDFSSTVSTITDRMMFDYGKLRRQVTKRWEGQLYCSFHHGLSLMSYLP